MVVAKADACGLGGRGLKPNATSVYDVVLEDKKL